MPEELDANTRLANVKYAEEQIERLLAFHFESFAILTKEATTTISWLFALIIGSAGYVFSTAKDDQWCIAVPLGLVCIFSGIEAWLLIKGALLTKNVPSIGSEPMDIASEDILNQTEANLRLGRIRELQGNVDRIRQHALNKGDAINRARRAIIIIPAAAILLAALLYATSFLSDDLPCVFRL
jgi:hypothetical protein